MTSGENCIRAIQTAIDATAIITANSRIGVIAEPINEIKPAASVAQAQKIAGITVTSASFDEPAKSSPRNRRFCQVAPRWITLVTAITVQIAVKIDDTNDSRISQT